MKASIQSLKVSLLACLLFCSFSAWATHISGGYIAYKWLQGNDYEITVGLFYDSGGVPISPEQQVYIYGLEAQQLMLPLQTYINPKPGSQTGIALYKTTYTFPEVSLFGGIRYKLGVEIQNRNGGSINIAAPSDQIPFYIETEIYVNSFLGFNSSSIPTDTIASVPGEANQALSVNLSFIDPDGDSLVYKLVAPRQSLSREVEGYRSPETIQPCNGCTFMLNSQTGQLTWNKPLLQGSYAVAVRVEEWRKIPGTNRNIRMGYIIRDIQLNITD